ncbi:MAG: aminopeptidase P family protein [Anaerolineae bacterium]|nr:aminopeptidase P family protein [Anaerolineae bacterium]
MNYSERQQRFQEALGHSADLAFLPVSADLQYLTGVPRDFPNFGATIHPGAWLEGLWMAPQGAPLLALPRMTAEFGGLADSTGVELRILGDHDDPAALVREIAARFGVPPGPRIALGDRARAETASRLHAIFPGATFVSATDLLRPLRAIKSEAEIAIMRRAGAITEAAFADVLPRLRHGITELEIMAEVDYQLRRHGSLGPSFTTALYNTGPHHELIFGKHEQTWHRPLKPPVAILFDFGAIYEGYCYDYGRTVYFGQPDEEMQRVHELVMASQAAGIAALRAGQATAAQADAAARQVIEEAGYGPNFRHRLGHGIGLDVHEPPFLTAGDETVLAEGMLFTVEPSILVPWGPAARVEDVVIVRPGGGEPLTTGYPSLIVID